MLIDFEFEGHITEQPRVLFFFASWCKEGQRGEK